MVFEVFQLAANYHDQEALRLSFSWSRTGTQKTAPPFQKGRYPFSSNGLRGDSILNRTLLIPGKKEEWDEMWYICAKEAAISHRETYPSKKDYGLYFQGYLDFGHSVSEEKYANAMRYRENISVQFRDLFSQVEVIVSPSGGMPNVLSEEIVRGPMSGWDPYLRDFDWHFTTLAHSCPN